MGQPKFNHLYLQTQFGEDRCTQFRVIMVTDPQTQPQTHTQTGPITIRCTAASMQCNNSSVTQWVIKQEAQLMLTTGSTRLAVNQGQQTQYHSICYI